MITFGYKKQFASIARAFIAIGLGVVMFLFKIDAIETIVRIIGVGILFAGVISVAPMFSKKDPEVKQNKLGTVIGWTVCGIATIIGLVVLLKPLWFAKLFVFLLAAAVIVFCVIQLMALVSAMRLVEKTNLPMILSACALLGAIVVMFFQPGQVICYTIGVLLVIYGASELIAMGKIHKAEEVYIMRYGPAKEAEEAPKGKQSGLLITGVKDADYEEVKRR
ncbi:MAG: DUF308 domain-containing protein [Bacteroidota bacterium]|nr:DUF308 domain-containing protein [Bacteroidota bacterium]